MDETNLAAAVAGAGIARPPLGGVAESSVNSYGPWSWGSISVPPFTMYMFEVGAIARMLRERGAFFAFSHAGHGLNSYGLSLVTAAGPLAAFVQHHYGGVYSDRESQLIAINATYSRLDVLLEAARHKGEVPLRWMLVYSNFRGACGIIGLGPSATREAEDFDGEESLFRAAEDRLSGTGR